MKMSLESSFAVRLSTIYSAEKPKPIEMQIFSSTFNYSFLFHIGHQNIGRRFMQLVHWIHFRLNKYYRLKTQPFLRGVRFNHLIEPLLRLIELLIHDYLRAPIPNIPGIVHDTLKFSNGSFNIPPRGLSFAGFLATIQDDLELLCPLTIIRDINLQIRKILSCCDEAYCMVIYNNYFMGSLSQYSQIRIDRPYMALENETFDLAKDRISNRPVFVIE